MPAPLKRLEVMIPLRTPQLSWGQVVIQYRIRQDRRGNRFVHYSFLNPRFEELVDEGVKAAIENQCLRHDARYIRRAV